MKQRSFSSNFTLLQYCCYGDWTSQFIVNRAHAIRHWMKCHSSLTNVEVRQWQWLLEMTGYYSHALLLLSYCAAWLKIDCWEEPLQWQGCNGCCRCHHCVVVSIVVIIVHISWRMHGHPCTEAVSSSSAGLWQHLPPPPNHHTFCCGPKWHLLVVVVGRQKWCRATDCVTTFHEVTWELKIKLVWIPYTVRGSLCFRRISSWSNAMCLFYCFYCLVWTWLLVRVIRTFMCKCT